MIKNIIFDFGDIFINLDKAATYKEMAKLGVTDITEEMISDHNFTVGLPDPDLIVRTSGEFRISNFLIWQGAYAEIVVTDTHWPDYDEASLRENILEYAKRKRRFGGLDSD